MQSISMLIYSFTGRLDGRIGGHNHTSDHHKKPKNDQLLPVDSDTPIEHILGEREPDGKWSQGMGLLSGVNEGCTHQ